MRAKVERYNTGACKYCQHKVLTLNFMEGVKPGISALWVHQWPSIAPRAMSLTWESPRTMLTLRYLSIPRLGASEVDCRSYVFILDPLSFLLPDGSFQLFIFQAHLLQLLPATEQQSHSLAQSHNSKRLRGSLQPEDIYCRPNSVWIAHNRSVRRDGTGMLVKRLLKR